MATVRKIIKINVSPENVWDAVRDVGAVHERLAPGFVTDTTVDGDARTVTFANGMKVIEFIVTIDDDGRRLAYASIGGRATHHNASIEILGDGDGATQFVWTTDVLPHDLAPSIAQLVEGGAAAIKTALERANAEQESE
jgi:hypothetical protein